MKEFQTTANDFCQRALVGSPISASLLKEFFTDAQTVINSVNAVRATLQAFPPNFENDVEPKTETDETQS